MISFPPLANQVHFASLNFLFIKYNFSEIKRNWVWGKKYIYRINLYCILLILNLYFRYSYNIQSLKNWNILSKHKEL